LRLLGECVKRGGEPAAEHGRGDEVQLLGQSNQVEVGGADRHLLRERAGVGESGLGLFRTNLRMP